MESAQLWPPIVQGRFGLEQRSSYRHHDLFDEEVPEFELESAVARLELGASCAVRSFLLLGDQNAGKSTMLHSFCREGDPRFMQLSSLLPVLSSSFLNTRLMPQSRLQGDLDQDVSVLRDEMPFMDTDVARGVAVLTLENFLFFCAEFGIAGYGPELPEGHRVEGICEPCEHFGLDVSFVGLQFLELGGDHLDRLLRFSASGCSLEAVRAAEPVGLAEEDAFWSDVHEVLLGSLRLLADTTRTVYFINCATLFPSGQLCSGALRPLLRKLRFLDQVLGGNMRPAAAGAEVLFFCSRVPRGATLSDLPEAWAAACAEVRAFVEEEAPDLVATLSAAPAACDTSAAQTPDDGLDLSPLVEVSGEEAAREWRDAEAQAGPFLVFIEALLRTVVFPALNSRLRFCGIHAMRNLDDGAGIPVDSKACSLCVPSVVRNVARLLQRHVGSAPGAGAEETLLPQVAELALRCAAEARHVEAPSDGAEATIFGRWATSSDLAAYLEDCEARNAAVPFPEASALQAWPSTVETLVRCGFCAGLASASSGLPDVVLEISLDTAEANSHPAPVVILRAKRDETVVSERDEQDVLFVSRRVKTVLPKEGSGPMLAIGLPLDPELFQLLSGEASIGSVVAHLERGELASGSFQFRSPEATALLRGIHDRLALDLRSLTARLASTCGELCLARLLHLASDVAQSRMILGLETDIAIEAAEAPEPAAKRACCTDDEAMALATALARHLTASAKAEGLAVDVTAAARATELDATTVRVPLRADEVASFRSPKT